MKVKRKKIRATKFHNSKRIDEIKVPKRIKIIHTF